MHPSYSVPPISHGLDATTESPIIKEGRFSAKPGTTRLKNSP